MLRSLRPLVVAGGDGRAIDDEPYNTRKRHSFKGQFVLSHVTSKPRPLGHTEKTIFNCILYCVLLGILSSILPNNHYKIVGC